MRKEVSLSREAVISELVARIKAISCEGTVKVAIDGLMASGKTSLARELSSELENHNIVVRQASMDDFFNTEAVRYSRGFESAIGCYEDTFDLERLRSYLLNPLSQDGKAIDILIFEGLFLQRPELIQFWHYRIFLAVGPNTALNRAAERDINRFKSRDDLLYKHRTRYIPAQDLYMRRVGPEKKANCIIANDCLDDPKIVFKDESNA